MFVDNSKLHGIIFDVKIKSWCLCLVVLIMNMYFINYMLNGYFFGYGFEVVFGHLFKQLTASTKLDGDWMNQVIPIVTECWIPTSYSGSDAKFRKGTCTLMNAPQLRTQVLFLWCLYLLVFVIDAITFFFIGTAGIEKCINAYRGRTWCTKKDCSDAEECTKVESKLNSPARTELGLTSSYKKYVNCMHFNYLCGKSFKVEFFAIMLM